MNRYDYGTPMQGGSNSSGLPSILRANKYAQQGSSSLSGNDVFAKLKHHEKTLYILSELQPIFRCDELETLINNLSNEELRPIFQTILENIFGWGTSPGWSLRTMKRESNPALADKILRFLCSDGPLITLSYRLMSDPNLFYEFPVSSLPYGLQKSFARGNIPIFLQKKVKEATLHAGLYSQPCILLKLNNYLPDTSGHLYGWGSMVQTVYSTLLEDYLKYFMPTDGSRVPSFDINYHRNDIRNYIMHPTPQNNNLSKREGFREDMPTIFKGSLFQDSTGASSGHYNTVKFNTEPRGRMISENWRTETVLNVFIAMWLNNNDSMEQEYEFETRLPNAEVVKLVRVIVRHFHFFNNSVLMRTDHPLKEIKNTIFPLFQSKLYVFLNYLFYYWPLDNSFRIVYETWLSYIQPWRYNPDDNNRGKEKEGVVHLELQHCDFILDNILFYTSLFQALMPRFLRSDYSSFRSAQMSYRISKVFNSVDSLRLVLMLIEDSLTVDPYAAQHRPTSAYHFKRLAKRTRHPQDFVPSGIKLANAKQIIRSLEGPDHVYEPLFCQKNQDTILNVVMRIHSALVQLKPPKTPTPKQIESQEANKSTHWLRVITNYFTKKETVDSDSKDSLAEREKHIQFLHFSETNLSEMFELPKPVEHSWNKEQLKGADKFGLNDTFDNPRPGSAGYSVEQSYAISGIVLPKGVHAVETNELRVGNPDKDPIGSAEIAILIHPLSGLSSCLNSYLVPWASRHYYKRTVLGGVLRELLAEPVFYVKVKKLGPCRALKERKYLPPRISLRNLGNANFLYKLIATGILLSFLGVNGYWWGFIPFVIYALYLFLRLFYEPEDRLPNLLVEFGSQITE